MEEKGLRTLFFVLFVILFLVIFNYTLTLMAGLYIVSDLGGSAYTGIYTISFFAIGNILGVPLGRSLAGHYGTMRLTFISLLLFMLCSFGCVNSPNFPTFVIFRLLQGVVTGPFFTLSNRMFRDFCPPKWRDLCTSITLTILVVGPVIGATWGGWIAYDYNWRFIFLIDFPFILMLTLYVGFHIKKYDVKMELIPFDGVGYLFYALGVLGLSVPLIMGQELDWFRSPLITASFIVGFLSFVFFILWSLNHEEPIIDFRLLKAPGLTFALINLFVLFSTYFGTVVLLALWLSLYVNYTPIWVGLLLGTMAVAGILPSFLTLHPHGKIDHRIPLAIAIALFGISCFHTAYFFNVDIDFERIAYSRILAGFGLALFLPPVFRLSFRPFTPHQSVDVVVIFQFVRGVASGLGASLFSILWQRRQVFYHQRLGGSLTPFSAETHSYFQQAHSFGLHGKQSLEELDILLNRQATSLALNDCFYLMGWMMVGLFFLNLLTLFSRRIDFSAEA